MDATQYEKAKKAVQAKKARDNYLVVKIGYDIKLILPYKAGLAFMEAIGQAEKASKGYGTIDRIVELPQDSLEISTLSAEDYDRYKIAALLNVTIDEVRQYEQAPVPA